MKVVDKVICINNYTQSGVMWDNLTIDKEYKILNIDYAYDKVLKIYIEKDNGCECWFYKIKKIK